MCKLEILTDDFLKQFKTVSELNNFLEALHRRGLEKILEVKLVTHLSHEKHQKSSHPNSRNGYGKKKIRTHSSEQELRVPRDREGSFETEIESIPKHTLKTVFLLIICISLLSL